MSIQGGSNREDIRPLDHEGNYATGVLGNHRGASAAMNVINPQPNMAYYWELRNDSFLRRRVYDGWEVVPPDAPERKGQEIDSRFGDALDSYKSRRDVVLMRIPIERYRELKAQEHALATAALNSTTDSYLAKGEPFQRRYGSTAAGPIYYRAAGHSLVSETE